MYDFKQAVADLMSDDADKQRSSINSLHTRGQEGLKYLLDLLEDLSRSINGITIVLPDSMGSIAAKNVETLSSVRTSVIHILAQDAQQVSSDDLNRCAALTDLGYTLNFYYPPAALDDRQAQEINFSEIRKLATEELRIRGLNVP